MPYSSRPLLIAKATEGYIVKPSVQDSSSTALHVTNSSVDVVDAERVVTISDYRGIAGIIGIVSLRSSRRLITVESAKEAGSFLEKKIYQVTNHKFISLDGRPTNDEDDQKYLSLLKQNLQASTLFFSYEYDLTNSLQRQKESSSSPEADSRFFWNRFLQTDLLNVAASNGSASQFVLPMIYGYANLYKTCVNEHEVTFGLITRRSVYRAGTRYFRRGIDKEGNAANFNETEQILIVHSKDKDHVYSYLQTRGSVPVFWAEINNLRYKPNLFVGESSVGPTKKHFDQQVKLYGTNYLVNLVNQSGYEKPIKEAYESAVTALDNDKVKYIYFDFHHECRKMRWDRVKLLLEHLSELGYSSKDCFHYDATTNHVISRQGSVVRTNCMDCLDRTNVVQSTLGRWFLQAQLEDCGIVAEGVTWEADYKFNLFFMNVWADNADYVSKAYSGTGALKTDFTRTGFRTKHGAFSDLCNSITRYVKNNYRDGSRQDGFDLFLGNFVPLSQVNSPFHDHRPSIVQVVPSLCIASLAVLVVSLIFPRGSLFEWKNVRFLGLCLTVFLFSLRYIVQNGYQFVNWPRLCALDFLEKREIIKDGKFNGVEYKENSHFVPRVSTKKD